MKLEKWEGEPSSISELIEAANKAAQDTAEAHQKFLELSGEFTRSYAETFNLQTKLLQKAIEESEDSLPNLNTETSIQEIPSSKVESPELEAKSTSNPELPNSAFRLPYSIPVFPREACMEFAVGSVAKVLGPEFAAVDTYEARVRLPDEPLMLVDRILSVDGEKGSLGPGRIVTEHDVLPDSWYLDGGHAPVCISVEAGQADLFLCSYLGIDLKVKGLRTYRLLDATVKFHRELPVPGETIRYEIEIEKFLRQGETYLFLFHFNGYIGDTPLITMTNGCAGFFTEDEVKNSGGIILTEDDRAPQTGKRSSDLQDLVPVDRTHYDDDAIQALRAGNLAEGFGKNFDGITLPEALRLPSGRMKLIDRVIHLDPAGGRFGLGLIQAEADIHPDDWFLTCHFVDDMVMPGTLMYECCAHTLRIFLQRIGWVTDKPGVFYEPVRDTEATLKCRGPVTPETAKVIYEIEIKEIGYRPEPYALADAYMYADGDRIVYFRDMSLQMSAITREEIESLWNDRHAKQAVQSVQSPRAPLFDRNHMLEFAEGMPSRAFGKPYEPYDRQRFIARLPGPPYLLIDRIVRAEPDPWALKPDGWIEAECDVDPAAWYFKAERTPAMPVSIILEIALQPCGWLAAYMGSALRSQKDLRFRNLGGCATLYSEVLPDAGVLTVRARLTNASEAADMIIEHFDFEVMQRDRRIYAGNTYFGFFTRQALAQQEGVRDAASQAFRPSAGEIQSGIAHDFMDEAPLQPDDQTMHTAPALALPARAIRMIDRIESYIAGGGPAGLGFVRGTKTVDPTEWFFKAHFYQDPVCPGSLGIESFIQLLKFAALQRWPRLEISHRFGLLTGSQHTWIYRGQIIPENKTVTVDAVITEIQDEPEPSIKADGYLAVDGLYIYKMENFGIKLVQVV
jgi:3-hydroxymyristoyl/3-hydroxydecanoyl-(acyl carrier protein) dehydratase